MHKLYELKEMLCDELKEYGDKDKLDVSSLEIVDTLAHAIKNIDKIIEAGEEDYSMRGSYYDDGSYMRGRSYAKRDSRGRYSRMRNDYSRDNDMVMELRDLMNDASDEHTRRELQKMISKMENM